jgi:hypothetical protein
MRLALVALALALALTACRATAPQTSVEPAPPSPAAPALPQNAALPGGAGCAGEIARYRAVQENDRATGNIGAAVYATIQGEIAEAERACSAGDGAGATALLRASKARHGYPPG